MIPRLLTVRPAYGHIAETPLDLIKAWNDGLDFQMHNLSYMSIRDVQANTANIKLEYQGIAIVQTRPYITITSTW